MTKPSDRSGNAPEALPTTPGLTYVVIHGDEAPWAPMALEGWSGLPFCELDCPSWDEFALRPLD